MQNNVDKQILIVVTEKVIKMREYFLVPMSILCTVAQDRDTLNTLEEAFTR